MTFPSNPRLVLDGAGSDRPPYRPAALPRPECSKGWGKRCAASHGPRCRCACGGHNHGNPAARSGRPEAPMNLSNTTLFQRDRDDNLEEIVNHEFLDTAPHPDAFFAFVRSGAGTPMVSLCQPNGHRQGLRQLYVAHSPTGFEWGYGGSGPADLALNILGRFIAAPEAWLLHQDFKRAFIAALPREGGELRAGVVRDWILQQWGYGPPRITPASLDAALTANAAARRRAIAEGA